jgi:hypothetical protein
MSAVIDWLLGDDNPAVKYRTQTEILGQEGDKAEALAWLSAFLPADWRERTGLWSTYYLSSFAECGLSFEDTGLGVEAALGLCDAVSFDCGCADFMRLRALVRLGLGGEPSVMETINWLSERQLGDGGFLCLHRLDKLKYVPKSCVKVNVHALLLCAECKKRGIETAILNPLLDYFWKHRLFYRTDRPEDLILDAREGWRSIDAFYPFEPMRVGLQNIVDAFSALGYGNDERLSEAWALLKSKEDAEGKLSLEGTLTKSYLPKERAGKPSKWATFYAALANSQKHCT